jgi:hypothetical protein
VSYSNVLWHIDPLLGKDLETDSETTAIAMQQHSKHTSTTIELLLEMVLCNPLLGSYNNGNGGVFYMVYAEELS